jgi:glycosyltransferase involved in cell wall biosynthesis
MRVLHIVWSLDRSQGGVPAAVKGLCNHLVECCDVDIVTATQSGENYALDSRIRLLRKKCRVVPGLRVSFVPGFTRALKQWLAQHPPDLMHVHGLWMPQLHVAFQQAAKQNIPCVLSPHGMLKQWALHHHAWKKNIALRLYQQWDLKQAKCLHATAQPEADQFRHFGIRQPIALVPLGLDLPSPVFSSTKPLIAKDGRNILFLSRLHPSKGVFDLVGAWARVRQPGWRVVVAGPDEDGNLAEVKRRIGVQGMEQDFVFTGPVFGKEKENVYAQADLFVLPSYSENFGLVVLEAMAHGVSVITTRATPWRELETCQCGWWIDVGVDALTETLRSAIHCSDAQRQGMGQRGRELVQTKYQWPVVARQMTNIYTWILQGGLPPDCVQHA